MATHAALVRRSPGSAASLLLPRPRALTPALTATGAPPIQRDFSRVPASRVLQRQTPQNGNRNGAAEGESLFPDIFNAGVGTLDNQTSRTFKVEASEGKSGALYTIYLGTGEWGDDHPAPGPNGLQLRDIDFVYPSAATPINGQTSGRFKIGSNDATITPDPAAPTNSKIDDFNSYEG